jgi:hypothetical protein
VGWPLRQIPVLIQFLPFQEVIVGHTSVDTHIARKGLESGASFIFMKDQKYNANASPTMRFGETA